MFKLNTRERISLWKSFRKKLDTLSFDESLHQVVIFWQACPFTPYHLNPESNEHWPDPWQLIEENCYCDLAKCLGIVYTLHLTVHAKNLDPEIRIYVDEKNNYTYCIAYLCRGKYVLNLIEGTVVNKEHINQTLQLKYCYTAADLKLEQY